MSKGILLVVFALFAGLSQAKTPAIQSQAGKGYWSEYPTYLLKHRSVQSDLGLSSSTIKKVEKIEKDAMARYLAMMRPTRSGATAVRPVSRDKIDAERRKTDMAYLALLSPRQKARLKEIGLQYSGPYGLGDLDISRELQITPAQRKKLEDAATRHNKSLAKLMSSAVRPGHLAPGKIQDPSVVMKKMSAARIGMMKNFNADVKKILTPSQFARWKQMQGKPFPVDTLYAPPIKSARRSSSKL